MKTRKLTPKQTIVAFILALSIFTTMACGGADYTCIDCEVVQGF